MSLRKMLLCPWVVPGPVRTKEQYGVGFICPKDGAYHKGIVASRAYFEAHSEHFMEAWTGGALALHIEAREWLEEGVLSEDA